MDWGKRVSDQEPKLLKVVDVARELNLPRSSAYDLIAAGQIAGVVRIGRRIRVPAAELQAFIQKGGQSAA